MGAIGDKEVLGGRNVINATEDNIIGTAGCV